MPSSVFCILTMYVIRRAHSYAYALVARQARILSFWHPPWGTRPTYVKNLKNMGRVLKEFLAVTEVW